MYDAWVSGLAEKHAINILATTCALYGSMSIKRAWHDWGHGSLAPGMIDTVRLGGVRPAQTGPM